LRRYQGDCSVVENHVEKIWSEKFRCIAKTPLGHLTLDLRDALRSDRGFRGTEIAETLSLARVSHGIPAEFVILTPSGVLEDIYDMFREANLQNARSATHPERDVSSNSAEDAAGMFTKAAYSRSGK